MLNVIENAKHKSETTANFAELLIYQEKSTLKTQILSIAKIL